jgi:hypothetical protein
METTVFDTKPLLRPAQLEEARGELKALEAKITDPGVQDKGEAIKQLRRVQKTVADQTPRPPVDAEEEGRMVRRSEQLLGEIVEGMPSQEEMRKAPPGAIDKHMNWERRNKAKILEWKNLQLRLTHGTESEAANLERHRPTTSSLNMDGAVIPGKAYFMPAVSGPAVTFSDEEIDTLRKHAPEVALKLALLNNEQRAEVKSILRGFQEDKAAA